MTLITKTIPIDLGVLSPNKFPLFLNFEKFESIVNAYGETTEITYYYGFYEKLPTLTETGENIMIKLAGTESYKEVYTNARRRIDIDLQTMQPIPAEEGDETAIDGFKSIGVIDFNIKTVGQLIIPDINDTLIKIRQSERFANRHNFQTMML